MAIKESALSLITSIAQGDWIRAVTSAGASRRVTVANLAKAIVESYTGSTLAGSSQSVKAAIDSLNSKTTDVINPIDITVQSGITNNLFGRRVGTMASVNGYLTASSAFGANQHVFTIAAGQCPVAAVRIPIALADFAYEVPKYMGYLTVSYDGKAYIAAPSGNTCKVAYFSFSYVIQA